MTPTYRVVYSDELYHYGVKGMKWGIRRALTAAKDVRKYGLRGARRIRKQMKKGRSRDEAVRYAEDVKKYGKRAARRIQKSTDKEKARRQASGRKRGMKMVKGAALGGAAMAAYLNRKKIGKFIAKRFLKTMAKRSGYPGTIDA